MGRLLVALLCACHVGAAIAGDIARSRAEVRAFRSENACPATGRIKGACPGFQVDHIKALCAGGSDIRDNMHWLSTQDHKFKTFIDVRECRKFRRLANTPAR